MAGPLILAMGGMLCGIITIPVAFAYLMCRLRRIGFELDADSADLATETATAAVELES